VPGALVGLLGLVLLAAGCGADPGSRLLPRDRGEPLLYVALGDSTVAGIGASRADRTYVSRLHERLRHAYPAAQVENLGVPGATSADVLTEQLPRAIELGPGLVTLSIGPNDVTGRVTADRFEDNCDRILAALEERTRAVIVLNLLPDLAVTPRFRVSPERDQVGRAAAAFNESLRRVGRKHGAEIIDLYGPSRDEVPRRPELLARDGYHPSDVGYARWAELMWPGVEARIAR
jgi:acyl-CoA thioesterase I